MGLEMKLRVRESRTSGAEKSSGFEVRQQGFSDLCSGTRFMALGKFLNVSESFYEEDNY